MSEYERTELSKLILERMNLPPEFWRSKLTEIEDNETREVIGRYLKKIDEMVNDGIGLVLYGKAGIGKTTIAALIAKEARTWKHTVFFTMIWELRECVRSRVPFDDSTSILDRCRQVDVLVLDGFVEEDVNDRLVNARTLEQLITYRGQRGKVTIVTTRIGKEELRTGKGLKQFTAGTESYMFMLQVKGKNRRGDRKQAMRDKIFGED